jgi:hypothetical protein
MSVSYIFSSIAIRNQKDRIEQKNEKITCRIASYSKSFESCYCKGKMVFSYSLTTSNAPYIGKIQETQLITSLSLRLSYKPTGPSQGAPGYTQCPQGCARYKQTSQTHNITHIIYLHTKQPLTAIQFKIFD